MKFGIIKERKSPPDRRVVFTPEKLAAIAENYPDTLVKAEVSDIRIFKDEEYIAAGVKVDADMTDCDVLIGVKEVPVEALIPNKKYFFFSHTIKKQPYNQKLLQAILDKNIELYDHETIVDAKNKRLIGFGRYAGNVGAYNTLRAFGVKYELYNLPKAETLPDRDTLIVKLKRMVLPPVKIVLTGKGKVAMGAKEMLDGMKMKQVNVNDYLTKNYDEPVYVQLDVLDYNRRKDGEVKNNIDFYNNPAEYESNFERFTKVSDIFITGHFFGNGSPDILTREMLKASSNKIKVVGDVSCDIGGPIACTLRASTIADPIYGYNPSTNEEIDFYNPSAIVVMAVDNLPCELPRDASVGFAEMFYDKVIPAFFNGDKDGILARAKITENGKLTERFKYLKGYVEEK
ncbi:alanine dehydrogenase [Flavobacterium arcticum]|uniref:Saccharopine dehydrogenase [NAD(+), L-lysine-forming] n=1 Tax=Flavobacterium arcticum TaxID=1784713 RepID=A0A345HE68_9FLAO|nr:NAD(P)-dependent oxidoreductase [Flavobacterium arcticum]AXG74878.1 alanine dehydrogenase [Flavobacterium arcticum]KAF2509623.1 alanine dehydrogenase [Flavobacterium arcticum]